MLREEARVVRQEYERLAYEHSTEAYRRRLRLRNRYLEIHRLLGAGRDEARLARERRRRTWKRVLVVATVVLVLTGTGVGASLYGDEVFEIVSTLELGGGKETADSALKSPYPSLNTLRLPSRLEQATDPTLSTVLF